MNTVILKDNVFSSASIGLIVKLKGITSHASEPEKGLSPAFAMAAILNKRAFLKNNIDINFIPYIPSIGFSDDDLKNVEVMKKSFKDEPVLKTYYTAGGTKTRY